MVLVVLDEAGDQLVLGAADAASLFAATDDLEGATVSACPTCRCRVLACLALVDVLDAAPPHPRANELVEMADDAPSSHLYVYDQQSDCRHHRWIDPGRAEWVEVVRRILLAPRR